METSKVMVISYAYTEGSHQLQIPNFADNWPIFTIESSYPNNFSLKNYCSISIVIANLFFFIWLEVLWLSFLWQDVATDYLRPKTNKAPFEVTRQDEISHRANIPEKTAAVQEGWSTEVTDTYIAIANYVSTICGTSTSWSLSFWLIACRLLHERKLLYFD